MRSMQDGVFSYDGPMKVFAQAIDSQILLPDLLDVLDESNKHAFYDGTPYACVMGWFHVWKAAR